MLGVTATSLPEAGLHLAQLLEIVLAAASGGYPLT
jgi:hypothetical protein